MAFTYDSESTSDRNRVRDEIGDIFTKRALFDDAQIDDLLTLESDNVLAAAARGCERLATRFARDFDFTADGTSLRRSSVSAMYAKRARALRASAGTGVVDAQRVDGYSQNIGSSDVSVTTQNLSRWRD